MKPDQMTHSALQRFAGAVDLVMTANDLSPEQRRDLIGYWAYQYARPDMLAQLARAIDRCQMLPDDPEFFVTATCRINAVTGEPTAFNPGN